MICIRKPLGHGGSVEHSKGGCVKEKFVFIQTEKLKILQETEINQTLKK
jgi:hypothetical protein